MNLTSELSWVGLGGLWNKGLGPGLDKNVFPAKLFMHIECQSICQYFFSVLFYRVQKGDIGKTNNILLSGVGVLMAFFQILYCSKPWKNISCTHCCGTKQKEESRKVKEKDHFNSDVIKIRSFNEFTQPQSRQLGTIPEFSRNVSTRRLSLEEVDG